MKNFFSIFRKMLFAAGSLFISTAFALPAVNQYISDKSGAYVFYQDYTFTEATYIGFLSYGNGAYAIRYYKPASKENSEVRNITVYMTVDENEKNLKMTGESIQGAYKNEDVDIINYIHDLMYEFTAARQNVDMSQGKKVTQSAKIDQFGGNVNITYSPLIPVFNILSVNRADGGQLLKAIITGQLASQNDKSFDAFTGKVSTQDRKHSFKLKKKAKKVTVDFEGTKITIDENWSQAMDNMYLLGDSAFLTITPVKIPEEQKELAILHLKKDLLCSSENAGYISLWTTSESGDDRQIKITRLHYMPEAESMLHSYTILGKTKDGLSIITLSVYESALSKNPSYFADILNTISF